MFDFDNPEGDKKSKLVVHSRRPVREEVISRDEILNLEIVLNTTSSVEEFLDKVRFGCQI